MTRYGIAVYLFAALLLDAAYQLHITLGGDRFRWDELPSTFVFFAAWAPLMPVIVRLAHRFMPVRGRRLRSLEVHFFAALAMSFATLFAHKLIFCPRGCYVDCISYYRLEAWMMRWFALDYLIYAGIVSAIWVAAMVDRSRARELKATAMERELAAAELRLMNAHVDPDSLIGMFRHIGSKLNDEPVRAERMITLVADYLRLNLRALGASHWTVGDDVELLRAWLAMQREKTGLSTSLEVAIGEEAMAEVIATPRLQPVVASSMPSGTALLRIAFDGLRLSIRADGIEVPA